MKTENKKQYIHFGERACGVLYWYLKSINIQRKWFLLPTNICPDVYFTFKKAGFNILWGDIEVDNLNLDLVKYSDLIRNHKIDGFLYNHTYGNEFTPLDKFKELKKLDPDLCIIDDRCLCMPDPEYITIPECINLVLFSTNKKKQIDLGFGGYGYSSFNHKEIKEDFNSFDYDALSEAYSNESFMNYLYDSKINTNWLNSGELLLPSDEYKNKIKERSENVRTHKDQLLKIYRTMIPKTMQLDEKYQNWRFNIKCDNRSFVLNMIKNIGFFAGTHYKSLGSIIDNKSFPIAEQMEQSVINLFIDFNYTTQMAKETAGIIKQFAVIL